MSNTILNLLSGERLRSAYRAGHWRSDTIYALLRRHAERAPDRFALRDSRRRLSYAELLAAVDRFAADLAARGLRPGDRVAVWLPNRIEAAIAMLACSRNGYICCPSLHRDHRVADIVALVARVRASVVIAEPGYGADGARGDIFAALAGQPFLRHVYRLEPPAASEPFGLADAPAAATPPSDDPDRVVYLAFTSGTTGRPKGVLHSDNTLLATARAVAADWHFGPETVVYTMSPLSHNLGMGALVTAMAVGGEIVLHDLPRGASLLDRLHETGAGYLIGVPTHAIDLLDELERSERGAPPALRGFRISGAAAPPEVVARLLRQGIVPQSGYGMTETCSHQYTLPTDDPRRIIETSGRSCAGYEITIWRPDDRDIAAEPGEIGEIGGRGASLMLGYFDDQAATEAAFNRHGWFMTGDLGTIDPNGYLRIVGRKKDIVIRGGHKIYPARIEAMALTHPAVERAAAFPVADERLGEKVCLAFVGRAGRAIDPAELLDHLDHAGLSRYDMPEYVLPLTELPTTATGKIRKGDLVDGVRTGTLRPFPARRSAPGSPTAG